MSVGSCSSSRLGEAEVHDDGLALRRDHHVPGLDVPVDDAGLVRGVQGARDLLDELDDRMISARVVGPDGVGEGSVPERPGRSPGSLDLGEMDERRVGRLLPLRLGRGDLRRERLALDQPHRDVGTLPSRPASYTAQMPG